MVKTKKCAGCKNEKPLAEFNKYSRSVDGLHYYCRDCQCAVNRKCYAKNRKKRLAKQKAYYSDPVNKERILAYSKVYHQEHSAQMWDMDLRYKYGISAEDYDKMLAEQHGVCAICGQAEKRKNRRIGVDHSHKTGRLRGLLCLKCNIGIGSFDEDPSILAKAITYLNHFQ